MSRSERISVRVTPERKNKWESVLAESNEWHNMTHLVVQSIENEIGEPQRTGPRAEAEAVAADVDLGPVLDRLDGIEETMGKMGDRLDDIDVRVDDSDAILNIATDIMGILPTVGDPSELERPRDVDDGRPVGDRIKRSGGEAFILEWAKETYDYPGHLVTRGLDKLVAEMGQFESFTRDPDLTEEYVEDPETTDYEREAELTPGEASMESPYPMTQYYRVQD